MFCHGLLISADSKLWYLCVPLALHDNRWNRQGSSSDDHRRRCLPVSPWIWWVPEECLHVSEWVHLPWNSWFARAKGRESRSFLLYLVVHFLAAPLSWKKQCLLFYTDFAGWGHHQHWCYCLLECTSYCFCMSNLAIRIFWGVLWRVAPGIPWWHLKNIFLWRGRWTY
jgi:hypothetical protein